MARRRLHSVPTALISRHHLSSLVGEGAVSTTGADASSERPAAESCSRAGSVTTLRSQMASRTCRSATS